MTLPVPAEPVAGEVVPVTNIVAARVNWGRWVADCSGAYCRNAWALAPWQGSWDCHLCGAHSLIEWPADPAAIEYVLLMRPDEATRHWSPGEPIEHLVIENVQHGVIPPELLDAQRIEDVLTVVDGRVVSGALLPGVERQREALTAGRQFALTAG